jgi:2,4-dienoyl-CoA reductase-like NADH-dependent reductase (Old Yellow Enzyme family)
MKPELIVMLTYNDKTVEDALELFNRLKDTPVTHWGFKDVGLPPEEMKKVVDSMNAAGKTTYLEVVSLTEEEGLAGAKLAAECGFNILMGTVFFDSINDYLKDKPVKYYPFPGHVHSHPSILDGTIAEIVQHARDMEAKGVDGMDLLTYRYTGDAPKLLREVVKATGVPLVSAGSIDSFDRIAEVRDTGAWGFTIGTAFFEKKFVPQGSFRENMMAVWDWLQKHGRPQ